MSGRAIDAFIALGANLGDPEVQVLRGMEELAALPSGRLFRRSTLYRSQPVGSHGQPDYVNAVVQLKTRLSPRELLDRCLAIEARHGRRRTHRNAPRTLDLDLLLYDGLVMHEPGLCLPHPRMHERSFVLQPLLEIAPHSVIPGRGATRTLLSGLDCGSLVPLSDPLCHALAP